MENKNICCECGETHLLEKLYKYNDEIYCWEHLEEKLVEEGKLIIDTYHRFFKEDYEGFYGDEGDTDIVTIIQDICDDLEIEEVE